MATEAVPEDLIERLRRAGDDRSAETVADIARALAMVKRYFAEVRAVSPGCDTIEGQCLEAINEALERVHRPL